ncbi:TadE/TadG family type IV pilus assembly protein [Oricola thermophila]|uniref:Pilus assembly protein n=1 Tax=Oricola thermophila TaxID=2742145 RepID=A0A6N1VJX1_9HYPH|nr:TadE/TadG family type IV pilus assembly protein [Oricola thermophila]QKV19217.1 pilus assembly protein [Oricola thermophila]
MQATRLAADRRGVAATEFVLLLPVILLMSFGLAEVYVEHATEDQFRRYVHQAGDLLAREPTLTTASITTILNAADQMIEGFDPDHKIDIHVSSIGFKADGTPVLLWTRSAGGAPRVFGVEEVTGMGLPADTVLRLEAHMTYSSPFNFIWESDSREISTVVYFRPRETRAIAMDGNVSETDPDWDYIPPE